MMTTTDTSYAEIVERDGFTVLADVLDDTLISELRTTIGAVTSGDGVYNREGVYAIRNLLKLAADVKNALRAPKVRDVVESVLGRDAVLVRGLYLDEWYEAYTVFD